MSSSSSDGMGVAVSMRCKNAEKVGEGWLAVNVGLALSALRRSTASVRSGCSEETISAQGLKLVDAS